MTILEEILQVKKWEVAELKGKIFPERSSGSRSLFQLFQKSETLNVIAEIKRASPSRGDINANVNPREQARKYVEAGAGAISVLTDETFFKGSMRDLRIVRETVDVPLLCKDFIVDPVQIDVAKANGADVILLIVAALAPSKLRELYEYAKIQDLEVLVEVHNEEELDIALKLNPEVIGINNRDLKTFHVNLEVTERLAKQVPKDILLISESGMHGVEDAERAVAAGARGILVGESFMEADDPKVLMERFQLPLGEKR